MKSTAFPFELVAALVAGLLPAGLAAQSYGPGDQVLTVAAPEFRGRYRPGPIGRDGDLYSTDGCGFDAPVNLPDGAEITQICLYARDEDPGHPIEIGMRADKLAPGGQAPGSVGIPGTGVQADFDFGYGVVCSDPLTYTIHDTA